MSQMRQIHDQLREMILSLDLGPGERLSERWLETKFGGSRTPVRAALVRLEVDGLVERDGRNWIVAPLHLDEIEQLAEFRESLEVTITRIACVRASEADLAALWEMLDAFGPTTPREEWHRGGTDFHVELARLSGNPFIERAMRDVMTRLSRPRWLEVWTDASRDRAWSEHRCILQCIRDRNPDEAAREAAEHVRHTRNRLLQSINENPRDLKARGFAIIGNHA
jgi:DNA-binding GntR family transcriptional regulator